MAKINYLQREIRTLFNALIAVDGGWSYGKTVIALEANVDIHAPYILSKKGRTLAVATILRDGHVFWWTINKKTINISLSLDRLPKELAGITTIKRKIDKNQLS